MPRHATPATSMDRRALDRAVSRLGMAMKTDSPRAALTDARAAGGPQGSPHLVAVAAAHGASRVARQLLADGWPAEALASGREHPVLGNAIHGGQNALWHAIHAQAGGPHAGSLARDLLLAGADASFIGPAGSAFGRAASAGDLGLVALMLASCRDAPRGRLHRALSQGLWEACGVDSPLALAACSALARAGGDWAYDPSDHHWPYDSIKPGFRFNCAQHAALAGSPDALADPAALAALAARQPPLKSRGPWTGWRDLVPPSRVPLVERWILHGETQPEAPPAPAARLRL